METNLETKESPNNVLLAEDDPKDRLETRLHLELMGFVVYDTPTGKEAKEIFEQRDFSLVLIHFSINPLQSLELCRWLRNFHPVNEVEPPHLFLLSSQRLQTQCPNMRRLILER